MRKRTAVLATVFGLLATACGGGGGETSNGPTSTDSTSTTTSGTPGAATYTVAMDNAIAGKFPASYDLFFPSEVKVHPGDSVDFALPRMTGEPHNVALGKLIDDAVTVLDGLPDGTPVFPGAAIEGLTAEQQAVKDKLPAPLPPSLAGSTEAAFNVLQPCYLATGEPPISEPCAAADRRQSPVAFDGSESFVESPVLLDDGESFRVDLSHDIAPGRHAYLCLLHQSAMHGWITVAPPEAPIAAPEEVTAEAEAQITALNDHYQPVADRLATQPGPAVDAGALGDDYGAHININVFPAVVSVAIGQSITWDIWAAHMITFNPPGGIDDVRYRVIERTADDRVVKVEPDPEPPSEGRPGQPQLPPPPSGGGGPPPRDFLEAFRIHVDAGDFDGSGFLHSGLLFSLFTPPVDYSVTFTRPGKFVYFCIRHPGMVGAVEVRA